MHIIKPKSIQSIYLYLVLGNTLAASFIWGINTIFFLMKDLGFTPKKTRNPLSEMKKIFTNSIHYGLGNPPVRWIMFAAPFVTGVSFYVFYALQPFLLKLYGDEKAYSIAGLAAAITAAAQIAGGFVAPHLWKFFRRRTSVLVFGTFTAVLALIFVSITNNFWLVLLLIFLWGITFAALIPVRQAYINGIIPSAQRATVLSFDSLMGSSGGIFIQPILGRVADIWHYPASYAGAALFQAAALPFILLARREKPKSDIIEKG